MITAIVRSIYKGIVKLLIKTNTNDDVMDKDFTALNDTIWDEYEL